MVGNFFSRDKVLGLICLHIESVKIATEQVSHRVNCNKTKNIFFFNLETFAPMTLIYTPKSMSIFQAYLPTLALPIIPL